VTSCASGLAVCLATGNQPDGVACGTNRVCTNGICGGDCDTSVSCTPAAPCHVGFISCATGAPLCDDTGTPVQDGTACGTNEVCVSGSCLPCDADAATCPGR
jgi:hypothetical protein